MKKKNIKLLGITILLFLIFAAFSAVVLYVDRQPVGVNGTLVGLATINTKVLAALGSSQLCYKISEYLGWGAFAFCGHFGMMGILQWIRRKNIFKVDARIIALGIFYFTMLGIYFLFDKISINYRPVLIDGQMEQSYPSSHTMMSLCLCATSIMNFKYYFKNNNVSKALVIICGVIMGIIMVTRILSGVHWLSDIIGSGLLASALSMTYYFVVNLVERQDN